MHDPLASLGLVPPAPMKPPKQGHKRCNGTGIIGYLEGNKGMPIFCSCTKIKEKPGSKGPQGVMLIEPGKAIPQASVPQEGGRDEVTTPASPALPSVK